MKINPTVALLFTPSYPAIKEPAVGANDSFPNFWGDLYNGVVMIQHSALFPSITLKDHFRRPLQKLAQRPLQKPVRKAISRPLRKAFYSLRI